MLTAATITLIEQLALLAIQNAPAIANEIATLIAALKAGKSLTDEQLAAISAKLDSEYQNLQAALAVRLAAVKAVEEQPAAPAQPTPIPDGPAPEPDANAGVPQG